MLILHYYFLNLNLTLMMMPHEHVSKVALLQSFLINSTSHINKALETLNAIKLKPTTSNPNPNPREEAALSVCEDLMESSKVRLWDSLLALNENTTDSLHDAHTLLSGVLTNHVTCLDGLEGSTRPLLESLLHALISTAETCLAMIVPLVPKIPNHHLQPLNGTYPAWLKLDDKTLLDSSVADIKGNANVVVAQDGSGNFKTLTEAVASVPDNSNARYVIYIKKGTYMENVVFGMTKKNVMLVGDGMDATLITGSWNQIDGKSILQSATVASDGAGFIAQDIWFQNTAGPGKGQAVALRVNGDRSVINRCKIDGYQDTLFAQGGTQFYRECLITGTVDFIFGDATVVFQKCTLEARKPLSYQKNMITAQGRSSINSTSAISIQQCKIIPSADLRPVMGSIKTYLGRPWKPYSRTIVMESFIDNHIDPAGWAIWDNKTNIQTLYYGEYMNNGPGSDTTKRVNWPGYHILNKTQATMFTVGHLINGNVWLKNTGVNFTDGL